MQFRSDLSCILPLRAKVTGTRKFVDELGTVVLALALVIGVLIVGLWLLAELMNQLPFASQSRIDFHCARFVSTGSPMV
jgi:hypothetical protein